MSGQRYTDADRELARKLRAKGWDYARLQEKFGVSKGTLSYWLNAESREKHLQRCANVRATGHSGSDRYAPENVAYRRACERMLAAPCSYCGGPGGTIDHMRPVVPDGDVNALENLTPACRRCNSSKAARTPSEWFGVDPLDRSARLSSVSRFMQRNPGVKMRDGRGNLIRRCLCDPDHVGELSPVWDWCPIHSPEDVAA